MDLQLCYTASEDTFPLTRTSRNDMPRLGFLHLPMQSIRGRDRTGLTVPFEDQLNPFE
jgi:hypothetical protein